MKTFNQIMAPLAELVKAKMNSLERPNLSDFAKAKIKEELTILGQVYDQLSGREEELSMLRQRAMAQLALSEMENEMLKAENMELLKASFDMDNKASVYFMEYLAAKGSHLAESLRDFHKKETIKKQLLNT